MKNYLDEKIVNVALQVLPAGTSISGDEDVYRIVDKAISAIKDSGVKYTVTPFETVMEGKYSEIMCIIQNVQNICYEAGAEKLLCYVKIQSSKLKDISIDEKIGKYS